MQRSEYSAIQSLVPRVKKKFPLEILMEQMKALVTERHDFDKDMNQKY